MEFQQKIEIRMIDLSRKFYLQNNDVTYTYCINLAKAKIRHQKLLLTCRGFYWFLLKNVNALD